MQSARLLASLTLFVGVAPRLVGQTASVSGPPMVLTPEVAKVLFASMASDLRNLVTAEESYFSDNNRYGRVLSSTDSHQVHVQPSPGVTLTLTYVTANSWAGRANHEWLGRSSCVIVVGQVPPSRAPRTAAQGLPPREEGSPICDDR